MTLIRSTATPTQPAERIAAMDILRGFALLGILLINIQYFSMPGSFTYENPAIYGDLGGVNRQVWILSYILADQKFMTIFSLLFGAGIALMTANLESSGRSSVGVYYRRTFWLLLFGLGHAYLIWAGDILVLYAVCGFWVYWLRKVQPGWQMLLGVLLLSVFSVILLFHRFMPPEIVEEFRAAWNPAAAAIETELRAYRGNWLAQMSARVPHAVSMQTTNLILWGIWRAGGLMLMGMALYKWGILTGRRTASFYLAMVIVGFGIGLPVVGGGALQSVARNWALDFTFVGWGAQANYWGSLFISAGYIGLVMAFAQSTALPWLQNALAAVGRTALTNYLAQSIAATTIFYGHGLGLFGSLERVEQIGVVAAIWAAQLVVSPLWLRRYRFGPLEWAWRSLTYWRLQPIRIHDL